VSGTCRGKFLMMSRKISEVVKNHCDLHYVH